MATKQFDVSSSIDNYSKMIQRKMATMFEREMNRIVNEYQDKLREALVDIASGYACEIYSELDDYGNKRDITISISWPEERGEKHS